VRSSYQQGAPKSFCGPEIECVVVGNNKRGLMCVDPSPQKLIETRHDVHVRGCSRTVKVKAQSPYFRQITGTPTLVVKYAFSTMWLVHLCRQPLGIARFPFHLYKNWPIRNTNFCSSSLAARVQVHSRLVDTIDKVTSLDISDTRQSLR
jgi:hypothetical protein